MRIVIDARMIKPGTMHGIARYVYHLLMNLKNLGVQHRFFVLINEVSPLLRQEWPSHIELIVVKSEWISISEHYEIPKVLRRLDADLFHAPSYVAPVFTHCNMVMTIHDLNHMFCRNSIRRCTSFITGLSCAPVFAVQIILTVSNFSKDEIVKNLGLPEEKVFVTYNGVSQQYQPVTDKEFLDYVRDIYELPEQFIFCLSNNKPHKNVQQLVRAYCVADVDVPLVLACPVDRNIIRIAENFGKKHLVYFAKFISEEHLPAVYSMTDLFVYPSTYEGFGLPPLEAISCGAPVIVSRSSSLPEVVGDHAIFTNPHDYRAIAQSLEQGISNAALRAQLSENGRIHARKFSWSTMAVKTLEIYERCDGLKPIASVPVMA